MPIIKVHVVDSLNLYFRGFSNIDFHLINLNFGQHTNERQDRRVESWNPMPPTPIRYLVCSTLGTSLNYVTKFRAAKKPSIFGTCNLKVVSSTYSRVPITYCTDILSTSFSATSSAIDVEEEPAALDKNLSLSFFGPQKQAVLLLRRRRLELCLLLLMLKLYSCPVILTATVII